jgi:hypothetical protein
LLGIDDLSTGMDKGFVAKANGGSCLCLYPNLVAKVYQLSNAAWGQPDTILVIFRFLWYTDTHDGRSTSLKMQLSCEL